MFASSLARAASRNAAVSRAGAARTLSVAPEHRPPVDMHGLHARYANATYIAASKTKTLEKVEEELAAIKATAKSSAAFASFLENPLISRNAKETTVIKMLGDKFSPVTVNLMKTLAGNARLNDLPKIVDTYTVMMKANRGEVEAVIISADKLTKAQTDAVAAAMKTQVGEGKKLFLTSKVDPTIIGGLQIQIGDKFLDLSVSSKIGALSRTVV